MNARINLDKFTQGMANVKDTEFFNREAQATAYGQKSGLSEIGRLRIGEKVKMNEGKERPASLDYFKVDTMNNMVAAKMHSIYGQQPKVLPIFFHTNDIKNHCIEELVLRDQGGKLVASGDGENFIVWSKKAGKYVERSAIDRPELPAEILEFSRAGLNEKQRAAVDWKHTIKLRFCIFKIPAAGYFQFQSFGSKTSIVSLRDTIDQCAAIWGGNIAYLPFTLSVKKVESNSPGIKRTYPVVDLVPAISTEAGIYLAQYIEQNKDFNPANFALMNMDEGQAGIEKQLNESPGIKLLR